MIKFCFFFSSTNPFIQPFSTKVFDTRPAFGSTKESIFSTNRPPTGVLHHSPTRSQTIRPPATIPKQTLPPPQPVIPGPALSPTPILPPPSPPPPPPPPARRLSVNSMETFIENTYNQLIDPFIKETAQSILT